MLINMVITAKFKITDMHCASCAMNIDGELEDAAGVISSATSYARQAAEVKFDEEKINIERIKDIIKQTGYEAAESD